MIARIAAEPHPFPVLGVSKKPAHDLQSEDLGLRTEWFPYTRDEPIIEGRARPLANDEPVNRGDEFGANVRRPLFRSCHLRMCSCEPYPDPEQRIVGGLPRPLA